MFGSLSRLSLEGEYPTAVSCFPEFCIHRFDYFIEIPLGDVNVLYDAFSPENAKVADRRRGVLSDGPKLVSVCRGLDSPSLRPFYFNRDCESVLVRPEIYPLLITGFTLWLPGADILAGNCKPLSRQNPQNRLVENILTKGRIHVTGRQVADIACQTALNSIEYVSFSYHFLTYLFFFAGYGDVVAYVALLFTSPAKKKFY